MLRKKQEVGGKIGHEEYTYYLGDPSIYTQDPRIRGQGDIKRGGPGEVGPGYLYHKGQAESRPPWGIDADDVPRSRRQSGVPGNALVPAAGVPSAAPRDSPYGPPVIPQNAWPSPQPADPTAQRPQPAVMAFSPVVGSNLPPVQPLSGLLPPIYRPKPPLSFNSAPVNPYMLPHSTPPPAQPLYYPPSAGAPYLQPILSPRSGPYWAQGPEIEMTPTKQSPAARPTSSPAGFLPPLFGEQSPPVAGRGRRRSSGGQIPGLGGEDEDSGEQQAQQAARRRAQQLQEENARLMEAQKRRKEEERQRKLEEDREEERRLQKEREAVAKREQAEVEREREEKEAKLLGPVAFAAKKREEAAARRDRDKTPSPPPSDAATKPAAQEDTKLDGRTSASTPAPYQQAPLFSLPTAATPPSASTHTSTSYTYLTQQTPQQPQPQTRFSTYSYETDHLKAELRQIADEQRRLERLIAESLRANQATAAATLRAVTSTAAGAGGMGPSLGAGTYLTEGLPSASGARRSGSFFLSTSAPPAPAMATATPVTSSSTSWLNAYLNPGPAQGPSATLGGAPPAPASTGGLSWLGTDATTSARTAPPNGGGISVLASQIHAAGPGWNSSLNRSHDPEDLSFEPSTFVGPVVPPAQKGPTVAPPLTTEVPVSGVANSSLDLTPPPAADGQAHRQETPKTPSILKKAAATNDSPHDSVLSDRRTGTSAVRWDEL